jgi:hypothetical protein
MDKVMAKVGDGELANPSAKQFISCLKVFIAIKIFGGRATLIAESCG